MTSYNAHLEYAVRRRSLHDPEKTATAILDRLTAYGAAVGFSPSDALSIRLTFTADSVEQASHTAMLVAGTALTESWVVDGGLDPAARRALQLLEVMTEAEFNAREGFAPVPELVSVTEAAEILGVARQRILQMIDEGKFSTATKVGSTTVIARSDVDAKRKSREGAP